MSKLIKMIPLADIERMAIVRGNGRLVSQVRQDTGCDCAMNAGFYDGNKPTHHLKADGAVLARSPWTLWGYAWDSGSDVKMEVLPAENRRSYIGGLELLSPMVTETGAIPYDPKGELGGTRGRTAIAHDGEHLILYCSGDGTRDASTMEALQDELRRLGAETAVYVDGGGSSQCDFGGGGSIYASRKVYSYLCVWLKHTPEEEKPIGKYTVEVGGSTLNIRKGPGTGYAIAGSYPDGASVDVLEITNGWGRTDKGWVSMTYLKAAPEELTTDTGLTIIQDFIAKGRKNRPGYQNPDSFITIHETGNPAPTADAKGHADYLKSDAAAQADMSWHYTVDDRSIYQHLPDHESAYHAGDGGRGPGNLTSIGIEICINEGGDFERAKANAASLVRLLRERHGLGMDKIVQHNHWNGKNCPYTMRTTGTWAAFLALCEVAPKADEPAIWAAEAWANAVNKGIFDGTRPTEAMTRQECAVVLDRLGLLDEGGTR